eukprot:2081960-Prymnesium_polylepis.1
MGISAARSGTSTMIYVNHLASAHGTTSRRARPWVPWHFWTFSMHGVFVPCTESEWVIERRAAAALR